MNSKYSRYLNLCSNGLLSSVKSKTSVLSCSYFSRAYPVRNSFLGGGSICKHHYPFDGLQRRCLTAGAGYGNVKSTMLYSEDDYSLFRHCRSPDDPEIKTVSVIGAPMTFGQPYVGTDYGPTRLREAGLLKHLVSLGWRVEDLPDLDFNNVGSMRNNDNDEKVARSHDVPNKAKNSVAVGRGAQRISEIVYDKAKKGRFPLVLGGDHSVTFGSLAGILRARPNTGVLWIDAHADLNTPATSETGNMHGMPVGLLMEEMKVDYASIPGCEWLSKRDSPRLNPDSIVYIGLRDVDKEERRFIRSLGIKAFTMTDIDHLGIGKVMDLALAHLTDKDNDRPIHLSYDIDAVDPALAPATGTTVRGGLTFREAHYVSEATAASGLLASADLVELNPSLSDPKGAQATAEMGIQIITSFMGKSIL